MSKRPALDLAALTAEAAVPMPEASQRTAQISVVPPPTTPTPAVTPPQSAKTDAKERSAARVTKKDRAAKNNAPEPVGTPNLEALAFKVSPAFRKRFRQCAVDADLKLNELLFEALDAWEAQHRK